MWALFSLAVIYFALLAASVYEDGMTVFELFRLSADASLKDMRWTPYTLRFVFIFLLLYIGGIALYYSSRHNRRPGIEHGSAKWGSVHELNRKYSDKDDSMNVILTQHLKMSMNGKHHMRNLLQIVVGGSGAGKTRFLVKPNIMLTNASFIVTDPKGEIARACIPLLMQRGYVIKVFDLIDPARSDSYNPFHYIRRDSDVFKLINNFIQNTTPKNAIEDVTFLQSIPLWLVSLLGSLFITVMSFVLILTVYGRFFKLYIYTALSPLPLAAFAGETTSGIGKAFIRSYAGVCLEGAVIVLACLIYSAFLSSDALSVDTTLPAVTMTWQYIGQLAFNMLVLTGLVKGSDRLIREMFSL